MKYVSTKEYKSLGPVAYRQWRADPPSPGKPTSCALLHGYALSFYFEFESDTLDARSWVIDFGSLRPLKAQLEEWFDHTLLVAVDDPMKDELVKLHDLKLAKVVEVERTGCEGLSQWLYDWINDTFLPSFGADVAERVWCRKVMVRETESNMAFVEGHRSENK